MKKESTRRTVPTIRQQTAAARVSERRPCCTMQKERIATGPMSSHAPAKEYEQTATYSNSSSRISSAAVDSARTSKPPARTRWSAKSAKNVAHTSMRKQPMDMMT